MELWDVYDMHRYKTGAVLERGHEFLNGELHMVVHVCMFNEEGQMLIQQRQSFKEGWPNMWDVTVGGSAVAGDTSQQAAARELFEELGIQYDFTNVRPHLTNHFPRGFDDIYLVQYDVDVHSLQLQYEEVQNAKWASCNEIIEMIREGTFIPYYESWIHLLFEMYKGRGTIPHL